MSTLGAEPDIDRRELIEARSAVHLDAGAEAVRRAWRLTAGPTGAGPATADTLDRAARDILRAVLAYFVQGGIAVADGERVHELLRSLSRTFDLHEWLRTVRLAGVETVLERLQPDVDLTRAEEARLRHSAERVVAALAGTAADAAPDATDTLRRLQSTGVDVR